MTFPIRSSATESIFGDLVSCAMSDLDADIECVDEVHRVLSHLRSRQPSYFVSQVGESTGLEAVIVSRAAVIASPTDSAYLSRAALCDHEVESVGRSCIVVARCSTATTSSGKAILYIRR